MFKYTVDQKHCFIFRQPQSSEDLEKMFQVLKTQDIMCIRCRSRDAGLLKELKNQGLQHACDF